jgi:hypothetical protein
VSGDLRVASGLTRIGITAYQELRYGGGDFGFQVVAEENFNIEDGGV